MSRLGSRTWIALGIVAVTGVFWAVGRAGLGQGPDNGGRSAGRVPGPGRTDAPIPVVDVHLELLEGRHGEPGETIRNLFRFGGRSETSPPPTVRPANGAAPIRATPPPPAESGSPPPPAIPLRFIGVVEAPGQVGQVAVLSDGRGNVFYGREGDIVEGRYRIVQIGPDAAEIEHIDGRGRQTIRFTGQ